MLVALSQHAVVFGGASSEDQEGGHSVCTPTVAVPAHRQ